MKVALLTNGIYPFTIGGMQKHSYYLARHLAQKEIEVDVYYFKPAGSKKASLIECIPDNELDYINLYERVFPTSIYFPGHYLYNSYQDSKNIYKVLKQNMDEVDFIYVQGFTGWKLLQKKRNLKNFPPIGVNFHGLNMFQSSVGIRQLFECYMFRYPVWRCLRMADYVFSLGGKLTSILEKLLKSPNKILKTPIGIENKWLIKKVKNKNSIRRFIFVGRYERLKGIYELHQVISKVEQIYDFTFDFIGPIPSRHRLKLKKCTYHGSVYDEDKMIEIVSRGDVLVCPSYSEGMPTVILEAMARGLAVIATDVGAVNELVSEQTGWLIQPSNNKELKRAIINAIELPGSELLQKKENAFHLIKKQFTWDNVIDTTLKKMDSV